MIRVGIIGCGKITEERHAPEYFENTNGELAGFYDRTRGRAEALARQYGGRVYDTPEDLFADPGIDAVSVCTANFLHAEMTVRALRAGKHVLCEKPMAVSAGECEEMIRASKEAGRVLMIAQNLRFRRAHQKAKELIAEGAIGRVLTFRTALCHSGPESRSAEKGRHAWFFDPNAAVLGALGDLGIHKADLIQYILGTEIVRTTARLATLDKRNDAGDPIGVDDNAICIFEMSDGVIGSMTASWTHYGAHDSSTAVYGTEGELRIFDDPAHELVLLRRNEAPQYLDEPQPRRRDGRMNSGVIDSFLDCIVRGTEPEVSGESALSAMRAIFASAESAKTGRTVEVPRA